MNKKVKIKISGASLTTLREIMRDKENIKVYENVGTLEIHTDVLEMTGIIVIEVMNENHVIINKGKNITTLYINNDRLEESIKVYLTSKIFKSISIVY